MYPLRKLHFRPDIVLFVSRINYQFPKYVSFRPDPSAYAINAFSLQWCQLNVYAFPPFSVIPVVLSKIQNKAAMVICVLPDWPAQAWYPKALQMLKQEQFHLEGKEGPAEAAQPPNRNTPNLAQTESTGLSPIREGLENFHLSSSAKDVLLALWRKGTSKQYQTYLGK